VGDDCDSPGLTRDDFTIADDGAAQSIRHCSAQVLGPGAAFAAPAVMASGQDPLAPQPHRLFVFLQGPGAGGYFFQPSVSVFRKATMSSTSWLVSLRFPISSVLTFCLTSGAGQGATSRVL